MWSGTKRGRNGADQAGKARSIRACVTKMRREWRGYSGSKAEECAAVSRFVRRANRTSDRPVNHDSNRRRLMGARQRSWGIPRLLPAERYRRISETRHGFEPRRNAAHARVRPVDSNQCADATRKFGPGALATTIQRLRFSFSSRRESFAVRITIVEFALPPKEGGEIVAARGGILVAQSGLQPVAAATNPAIVR